jgi:hypothetical protein
MTKQSNNQNVNYGEKTQSPTSYIKQFNTSTNIYNTTFRGEGSPQSFIKTINPSKYNGIFVKTFNNYNNNNSNQ